jgi:hypothetical protein
LSSLNATAYKIGLVNPTLRLLPGHKKISNNSRRAFFLKEEGINACGDTYTLSKKKFFKLSCITLGIFPFHSSGL